MEDVQMFPNRWFAYEPIDCVFLTTGRRDFMTALLNEREKCFQAGCTEYLSKPYDLSTLLDLLQHYAEHSAYNDL